MNKTIIKITTTLIAAAAVLTHWGCGPNKPAVVIEPSKLPQDVLQSCTVNSTEFNSWFANGTASENGLVMPANSIAFPHQNNCDFYKWSQQMFLWITSPTTSGSYGNSGSTVMESPVFYTVTPEDSLGHRTLVPHTSNTLLKARSNINQNGPNGLPVIVDKHGRQFEVESAGAGQKEVVKNEAGKVTELDHLEMNAEGKLSFIDNNGKVLRNAKPVIQHKVNASRIVHEFSVNGKNVFVDANGNQVETELGQAGSHGALMAQNGSLVYYISMVNDVYAYFVSGVYNNALNGNTFPVDSTENAQILAYARQQGWAAAPDSNALAIEIKTSWVETTNLQDSDSYITISAIIPEYNKSNDTTWVVSGERQARLALIGMHIVGSVAKHPEMIWATFEHENNAPNASYTYLDSNYVVKTVPQDTTGTWLLNANAADTPVNAQNMIMEHDTITRFDSSVAMGPSNIQRIMAWGCAEGVIPNAEDTGAASANSEVISINNAIRKLLVNNDIRKNYFMIGATWTFGGAAPSGISYAYPNPVDTAAGVAIGTSQLANSTMETFVQNTTNTYTQFGSCLSCHSEGNSLSPDSISHIFSDLLPLPALKKKK